MVVVVVVAVAVVVAVVVVVVVVVILRKLHPSLCTLLAHHGAPQRHVTAVLGPPMPTHGVRAQSMVRRVLAARSPPNFLDRVNGGRRDRLPAKRPPLPAVWQTAIRAAYYRGGTSRAVIIQPRFLPKDRAAWPAAFRQIMGSGDPYGRQLDGMGAGISSLSKICLVEPFRSVKTPVEVTTAAEAVTTHNATATPTPDALAAYEPEAAPETAPEAHIDYTFVGVGIETDKIDVAGNCGNMSSAIGPYAYNARLLPASLNAVRNGPITVKIRNTNTEKIIHSTFEVFGGQAAVDGDYNIDGVTGPGSKIKLAFTSPYGSKTGKVLPTGKRVDRIAGYNVSCVDGATPAVFLRASDVGVDGTILPDDFNRLTEKLALLERIRKAAAVAMGIAANQNEVPRTIPKIGLISQSSAHAVLSGQTLKASQMDVVIRFLSDMQPHRAIPLTAALTTAIAAKIPGTIVDQLLAPDPVLDGTITIGHASGRLQVNATMNDKNPLIPDSATVYRTAKRLFEGETYWVDRGGLVERPNYRNRGYSLGMSFVLETRAQNSSLCSTAKDGMQLETREQQQPEPVNQESELPAEPESGIEATLRQLQSNINTLLESPSVTSKKFPPRLLWSITRTSTRVTEHTRALDHTTIPSTPLTGALLQLRAAIGDLMAHRRMLKHPFPAGLRKDMQRTEAKIVESTGNIEVPRENTKQDAWT